MLEDLEDRFSAIAMRGELLWRRGSDFARKVRPTRDGLQWRRFIASVGDGRGLLGSLVVLWVLGAVGNLEMMERSSL